MGNLPGGVQFPPYDGVPSPPSASAAAGAPV